MEHNFLHHNWLIREPCNHCAYRNTPANGPLCGGCLDKPKTSESKESAEKSDNSERDAIKKTYIEGYSKGHNDTVECGDYCPEESADDWLSE